MADLKAENRAGMKVDWMEPGLVELKGGSRDGKLGWTVELLADLWAERSE